jgi:4-coumarate--CoA ligase (photoactive yellow protein activation family)
LARVLQSLLTASLKAARGGVIGSNSLVKSQSVVWADNFQIIGESQRGLGCDSLEVMLLAAAANEMFHLYEAKNEDSLLSTATFGGWLDSIESAWSSGVSQITFMTSGSTGPAKLCVQAHSHLQTEILYLAQLFSGRKRIFSLAPAHHIYGFLLTAMLPDELGIDVVSADHVSSSSLRQRPRRGDLIVSIPEYWQWLNRTVPVWPEGVCGVVSTSPCPPDLISSLVKKGLNYMVEIYGSSETSGVGVRTWPDNAYHLMPHWTREDSDDPGETDLLHNSGIQIRLMDRIESFEDGSFLLSGRKDGAVQVGGINVSPSRIAALLLARPSVADVAVRLMRPEEGMRLKAFIVPAQGMPIEDVRHDLEKWIEKYLIVAERPKAMKFGSKLPINPPGRELDW